MKVSVPFTLSLAAIAAAAPMPAENQAVDQTKVFEKRTCLLWWLLANNHNNNPPKPAPTTTPQPTTTTPCPTTTTPTTTTPCPTTTGPETKREVQPSEDDLAALFNFIDSASEADVDQFVHFYKNADEADIKAWWAGQAVTNSQNIVPSFPASRIHQVASS